MRAHPERLSMTIVLCAALTVGCASFRTGDLETVTAWPPPAAPGSKPAVNVTFQGITGELLDSFRGPTLRAYQESGLFSSVSSSARAGSGLRADVQVAHRGEANILLAMLTGLTLYVIPSTAADHYTVTTTFRDAQGRVLHSVTRSETVRLWQQLFLVFAMPFQGTGRVSDAAFYDLARASLADLSRSGAL